MRDVRGITHFFLLTMPVRAYNCCRCSILPSANTLSRFAALLLKGLTGFGLPACVNTPACRRAAFLGIEDSPVGDEGTPLLEDEEAVGPPVDWGVMGIGVVDADELADVAIMNVEGA